jgi:hypothetical protein
MRYLVFCLLAALTLATTSARASPFEPVIIYCDNAATVACGTATNPVVTTGSGGAGTPSNVNIVQTTPGSTNGVNVNPSNAAGVAITSIVSSAAESNHVFCSAACNLWGMYITTGATAGFVLTFDATTAPIDGAVTPKHCVQVPANASVSLDYGSGPASRYSTGLTAVYSTTGCFNKTASATAYFHGRIAQ